MTILVPEQITAHVGVIPVNVVLLLAGICSLTRRFHYTAIQEGCGQDMCVCAELLML